MEKVLDWIVKLQPLLIILGFILGMGANYFFNWQQSEKEFRKSFWDKYLNVTFDVMNASSKIINAKDEQKRRVATSDFLKHYYGDLILIENNKILNVTAKFKNYIINEGNNIPNMSDSSRAELNLLLINMGEVYRSQIYKYWNINLIDSLDFSRI